MPPKPSLSIPKIPIFSTPDKPLVSTTQAHLPIAEITNNLVLLKSGGAALVLETTSLNFGLLSEREQEAVVLTYAALLNSLSFTVQIIVKTQKKDISNYLAYLAKTKPTITNPKLKTLMDSYEQFITDTIKKKNVLGKRFFIVIPFSPFELGLSKNSLSIKKKAQTIPYSREYVIKKAQIVLFPKRDHLIRQAARLGIRARQLTDDELIKLYYESYNQDADKIRASEVEKEMQS